MFYFITKNEKIKSLLVIPTVVISILISVASLHINNYFVYEKSINFESESSDIIATVVEKNDNQYILKTSHIDDEEAEIKIFFATEEREYKIYETIFIDDAKLVKTDFEKNASDKLFIQVKKFNSSDKLGEKTKDFYYYALSLKSTCESKLSEYLFYDSFGIASGMLFGGTGNLSDELTFNFRTSGVAHLLAVSGLHTSLWCGLFISILKFLKLKEKYANLCGIFVLLLLVIISGFTPSVIRASFMMGITLIAPVFKKQSDSINSLGLAAGIILLFNPYILYSPSFYLSFLATLGVVTASKYTYKINRLFAKKNPPKIIKRIIQFVFESLLISIFATIFTLPASVYYFGTVSVIAPITNLLTINLAFVSMVMSLISLTTSFIPFEIFHSIAEILFNVTDYILKFLIAIIETTGSLKYASISANENFVYLAIFLIIDFTVSLLSEKKYKTKSSRDII
ncbi:MAG: ComEC/Rec2 family competence protein, partial [Clostridia bacterium]|nr:ComEC/Rec2 family competence protein [Clostridia bacterium]